MGRAISRRTLSHDGFGSTFCRGSRVVRTVYACAEDRSVSCGALLFLRFRSFDGSSFRSSAGRAAKSSRVRPSCTVTRDKGTRECRVASDASNSAARDDIVSKESHTTEGERYVRQV